MKKLFAAIIVVFFILTGMCWAADTTETLTFQWEQTDTTNLKEWRLYWSEAVGGPYNVDPVAIISYDPNDAGPTYTSSANAPVSGNPGTIVKKYFVLVACGDLPQSDGTTKYECSGNSNEVSHDFWIPAGKFSVPVQFTIVVTP